MNGALMGVGSRLEALSALATETSSERRRELLRDVTDLFFAPAPAAPEVLQLFDSALEKLTGALEEELRLELGRRLAAPAPAVPRRLAARLVADPADAVAEPLLAAPIPFSEADLLGAVAIGGQTRLRVVSRREDLTEAVSDKIVERGDDETVGVLVSNPAAPLSRAASERVVDRALANPALHEAVVGRESLPVDLLNEMYFAVEARLRERVADRMGQVDPAVFKEALSASHARMATRAGVLPPDYEEALASVKALYGVGPAPGQALIGFLQAGRHTCFMVALARTVDVDYETVRRVVARRDAEALVLLCRAAGYDAGLFRTLATLLRVDAGEDLDALSARFNGLTEDTAKRALRFWKVRRTTALAAA